MQITQIVGQLPPAIGGVGDYCYQLWRHWPDSTGQWTFLVTESAEASQHHWPEVQIQPFGTTETDLLFALEKVDARLVVLQYVGYAFHPGGYPLWLSRALAHWKSLRSDHRLLVMFHELAPDKPIWQRAFWTRRYAQKVVDELLELADGWITSCPGYFLQLAKRSNRGLLVPVGANILPDRPVDFERPWPLAQGKKLRLVIFGLALTRLWSLGRHAALLKKLCAQGWVESITLTGQGQLPERYAGQLRQLQTEIAPPALWQEKYDLEAADLSPILSAQGLGFVGNECELLTKSGSFAALSAHGVLTVATVKNPGLYLAQAGLREAVLLNDRKLTALLEQLSDPAVIAAKQRSLRQFYEKQLRWQAIVGGWQQQIQRLQPGDD